MHIGIEVAIVWFLTQFCKYLYLDYVARSSEKRAGSKTYFKETALWFLACGLLASILQKIYSSDPNWVSVVFTGIVTVVILFFEGTQLLAWCQTLFSSELSRQPRQKSITYTLLMYIFEIGGSIFALSAVIGSYIFYSVVL